MKRAIIAAFCLVLLSFLEIYAQSRVAMSTAILPETEVRMKQLPSTWGTKDADDISANELMNNFGLLITCTALDDTALNRMYARANSQRSSKAGYVVGETREEKRTMSFWITQWNEQVRSGLCVKNLLTEIGNMKSENQRAMDRIRADEIRMDSLQEQI